MGTNFSDVYDLFMQLQNDYRLIRLYQASQVAFEDYLESWLLFSIVDFSNCTQALTYDSETKTFDETLTIQNETILAQIMVLYWLKKEVQDITQMNLHLVDADFKTFSEAQNLREKRELLNVTREEISQVLQNYDYKNLDITALEG